VVLAVAVAGGLYWHSRQGARLTEKDTIVLADCTNTTGDAVFDDTLKQALAVDLEQSPFVNILSNQKLTDTLKLMGRSSSERLTEDLGREVCQRAGSKALLAGSISSLGSRYLVGLNAMNCATGDSLGREQVQAARKEEVVTALGKAASSLRRKLGESHSSIQKFDAPVEEATTPSLEALKAYSLGRKRNDVDAIPLFKRAVELDPNFAVAYAALASSSANLGQPGLAAENAKKAYDLRERVSEHEKYRIEAFYYQFGTGELEKASRTYELWAQSYPRDASPSTDLGNNSMWVGQWQKALTENQQALHLRPDSNNYSNLTQNYIALNRLDEARATLDQAMAAKLDAGILHLWMYYLAFLRNDAAQMEQQVAAVAGKLGDEDPLLSAQSDTEAYQGHLARARDLSHRAVESARHAEAKETAALWQANAALREAEFGNATLARQSAAAALALAPGRDVQVLSALTLARAGDTAQTQKLTEGLNKEFPLNTMLQNYWLPVIEAALELNSKNPGKSIELLQVTAPYELGEPAPLQLGTMYPVYVRGQEYLSTKAKKPPPSSRKF
jgi:hypothetical protein